MREEVLYTISMDLYMAYDALDRDRCLEILVGYGVGRHDHFILSELWDWLWMVACAGGYYRATFKCFQGVTQGYPLPPTTFNMVVNAVVCQQFFWWQ